MDYSKNKKRKELSARAAEENMKKKGLAVLQIKK